MIECTCEPTWKRDRGVRVGLHMRIAVLLAGLVACAPAPSSSPSSASDPSPPPPSSVTAYGGAVAVPPEPTPTATECATEARPHLPLMVAFPGMRSSLPVVAIGSWPTRVTTHPELAASLGLGELWLKRDDESAEPYGGGKARKLELLLGRAKADGRHSVITFGGVGSHHALATAVYAPEHGLDAVLMLLPQPRSDEVREVLLASHARGAELVMAGSMKRARRLAEARRSADPDGIAILAAGGSEPLGNVGFVSAGIELADQISRGELPEPDVVYLALGTMGSAIGLDIGLVAAGRPLPIVAVRASSRPISTWKKLSRMYAETVAFLRKRDPSFPDVTLDPQRFVVEDHFLGKGYAEPTVAGRRALQLGAEHDVALDLTYTAKAFAALRAAAKEELKGKRVLFWQSHAAHRLDVSDVEPTALPAAFRGWVVK